MKRIFLFFVAASLMCAPAYSQVSGTRRILSWPSITGTAAVADTTTMVLIDGTTIGTRATTLTNLGTAVLSTQSLVNSLTIKGTGLSISGTNGSLTLTGSALTSGTSGSASIFTLTFGSGTLTGAQTTTGVITLSGITATSGTINTLASTTGSITTGTIGSLFSTTGTITTGTMTTATLTTATIVTLPFTTAYQASGVIRLDTTGVNLGNSYSLLWKDGSNANGGSPYVGITSVTTNIIRVTNGSTGTGAFQTGGFLPGFVAATASTSLTIANTAVTVSAASVVTTTLPDGTTGPAGRLIMITNLGGTNVTITGFNATQSIDGAASVTLSSGSGGHFIYNGTNWNRLKAQ